MLSKYIKPKSLSFWSAIAEAGVNVLRAFGVEIPKEVDGIIIALFGIGLRGAVKDD